MILDRNAMLSEVLKSIRDVEMPTILVDHLSEQKGMHLSISRFEVGPQGFTIWVEFQVPNDKQVATGTLELELTHSGMVQKRDVAGHIMKLTLS